MRRLVLTTFAALSVFLAAGAALAQPSPRELFFQGQAAYESGEFQSAVDSWEAAYEQDPRPLLQFNIAQAYERLGQLQNAIVAYEIFIRDGSGDRLTTAQARLVALRRRLDATGVQLSGGPDGAVVRIDGADVGRLPRPDPFRVEPGPHRIEVEAEGYESFDSVIAVGDGQVVQVPVQMDARPTETGGGQTSTGEVGPYESAPAGEGGGPSTIGIILTIAGGAILAGGAVTGILALTAANNSVNGEDGSADDARTFALLTDILIPTGAVVAAVGVILMFVLKDGGGEEEPAVAPLIGPDLLGLSAQGRF